MLTAAAPCQPMPGPAGAAWPSARPGIDYCGPYPACCPPAARTWWQDLLQQLNPHGDPGLIALAAAGGLVFIAFVVLIACERAKRRKLERGR